MRIKEIQPRPNYILTIVADDDRIGDFDVKPYLEYEAFKDLLDQKEFQKISNGATLSNGIAVQIHQRIPLKHGGM